MLCAGLAVAYVQGRTVMSIGLGSRKTRFAVMGTIKRNGRHSKAADSPPTLEVM